MFTIFTAVNFIPELKKNINRASYSIELLIDQEDSLLISKTLLNVIEKNVDVIIVISATNEIKSLRVYNYLNRLIECGVRVYWNTDENIFKHKSYFLIRDKVNVINNVFYQNEDNIQNQVLYFNNIFDEIVKDSKEISINKKKNKN